ncbi:MAG TPA: hypothetical protein VKV29_09855 [Chthonomonas sp.]|uniref:hypothetical protein n=1 Tax=Chthonomonas sp. TaxID=2282153 RepID=UPI002B4B04F3|nr:hypothetical protein [Chthonomonas sp.]HLH80571.1 hypothetical protein [Chthonomonas sp.]
MVSETSGHACLKTASKPIREKFSLILRWRRRAIVLCCIALLIGLLALFLFSMWRLRAQKSTLLVRSHELIALRPGEKYYWASSNELVVCKSILRIEGATTSHPKAECTLAPVRVLMVDSGKVFTPLPGQVYTPKLELDIRSAPHPTRFIGLVYINGKLVRRFPIAPPNTPALPASSSGSSITFPIGFTPTYAIYSLTDEIVPQFAERTFILYDRAVGGAVNITLSDIIYPPKLQPMQDNGWSLQILNSIPEIFAVFCDRNSNQVFYLTNHTRPSSIFLAWLHHLFPRWVPPSPTTHVISVWLGAPHQKGSLQLGTVVTSVAASLPPLFGPPPKRNVAISLMVPYPPYEAWPRMFYKVPGRNAISFYYKGHVYLLPLPIAKSKAGE